MLLIPTIRCVVLGGKRPFEWVLVVESSPNRLLSDRKKPNANKQNGPTTAPGVLVNFDVLDEA